MQFIQMSNKSLADCMDNRCRCRHYLFGGISSLVHDKMRNPFSYANVFIDCSN